MRLVLFAILVTLFPAVCRAGCDAALTRTTSCVIAAACSQFEIISGDTSISSLKAALDVTSWNSSEHGPILAIAPEDVHHDYNLRAGATELGANDTLDPPPAGHGLRLDVVARHFNRRVVRLATLAAVVPTTMIVLNTHLKKADPFASLSSANKFKLLEGSLSAAQWRLLGSPDGIGVADLTPEQQALYLSTLPETVIPVRWTIADGDARRSGEPCPKFSGDDRARIRLHLGWTSRLSLVSPGGEQLAGEVSEFTIDRKSTTIYDNDPFAMRDMDTFYGERLRLGLTNRLKPGQIDFALHALDAPISTRSATTVGDLVRLVRDATKVDIYVDGRLATLPVYISDRQRNVRAGDLLQALCLALTGAIRKVGPDETGDTAYVLTNDTQGLGARRATIGAWAEPARKRLESVISKNKSLADSRDPGQYLSPQSDDPLAPSPGVMRLFEEDWAKPYSAASLGQLIVPAAALSAVQQRAVRREFEHYIHSQQTEDSPDRRGVDISRVRVDLETELRYLIPGCGSSTCEITHMDPALVPATKRPVPEPRTFLPLQVAPMKLPDATVSFAPKTSTDIVDVMTVLRTKGVRKVCVAVPNDAAARRLLEDAVAAGKIRGIAVTASIRLMEAEVVPSAASQPVQPLSATLPATAKTASDRLDINIFGMSGSVADLGATADDPLPADRGFWRYTDSPVREDVLAPESNENRATIIARLKSLAGVKGLAGIVLKEAAVPGHLPPTQIYSYEIEFSEAPSLLGYTVRNRLKFLRENGYDPIDLPAIPAPWSFDILRKSMDLPSFDTERPGTSIVDIMPELVAREKIRAWQSLREQEQAALLRQTEREMRALVPDLPVYLPGRAQSDWPFARQYLRLDGAAIDSLYGGASATGSHAKDIPGAEAARAAVVCFVCTPSLVSLINRGSAAFPPLRTEGASLSWLCRPRPGDDNPDPLPPRCILDFTAMPIADTIALLSDGLADKAP